MAELDGAVAGWASLSEHSARHCYRGVHECHAQLDGAWLDVVIVERLIPENQRA